MGEWEEVFWVGYPLRFVYWKIGSSGSGLASIRYPMAFAIPIGRQYINL